MNKTYIPAVISVILLAALHSIASSLHWYVHYHGFDIFMHILGGMALGFSIYWILTTLFPRHAPSFWYIILFTFIAGVLWETFEAYYNIAGAPVGSLPYYLDTAKDLINDTLGAIITAKFLKK